MILSQINEYDPMGLATPYTVQTKTSMTKMWHAAKKRLGWASCDWQQIEINHLWKRNVSDAINYFAKVLQINRSSSRSGSELIILNDDFEEEFRAFTHIRW